MLKTYLILILTILKVLLVEIKSLEHPVLRYMIDKFDINNPELNEYLKGKILQKAMNTTYQDISNENILKFLKINTNNTNLNNSSPAIDINNITAKFNCFYFNSDDFSVYDLSHLDKTE